MTATAQPLNGQGVVVLGSVNHDQVHRVHAFPGPGETVLAQESFEFAGGKGQAQATAAARFGSATRLIAAIGDDEAGRLSLRHLDQSGVSLELVRVLPGVRSGRAVVMIDAAAENSILVERGANAHLQSLTEPDLAAIAAARVLLVQLETGTAAPIAAIQHAAANGTTVVLNAAPVQSLPEAVLRLVDVLIVNEVEVRQLGGNRPLDAAVQHLLQWVPSVVVTLGGAGGVLAQRGEPVQRFGTLSVEPVDTTGAGDACCGVLAAAIEQGMPLAEGLQRALLAGSLAVQSMGCAPSIPDRAAVDAAHDTYLAASSK